MDILDSAYWRRTIELCAQRHAERLTRVKGEYLLPLGY